MKTINYRGGVVTFRIPSSWKEEYSDTDGGTFFEDKPDSGTFRIKVITLRSPSEITRDSALTILNTLKQAQGKAERMKDGNALACYEDLAIDRGHKIPHRLAFPNPQYPQFGKEGELQKMQHLGG